MNDELFEGEPIEDWRKIQDAGGVYEDPFAYELTDEQRERLARAMEPTIYKPPETQSNH